MPMTVSRLRDEPIRDGLSAAANLVARISDFYAIDELVWSRLTAERDMRRRVGISAVLIHP